MMSLIDYFNKSLKNNNKKIFLSDETESYTYYQISKIINNFSNNLINMGVKKSEKFFLSINDPFKFSIILLTASKLDLVIVSFNNTSPFKTVLDAYIKSNSSYLVVNSSFINDLSRGEKKKLNHVCKNVILIDKNFDEKKSQAISLDNLFKKIKINKQYNNKKKDLKNPFLLSLTSGSTGNPKPIILSEDTKIKRAQSLIELYDIDKRDKILIATPIYHTLAQRLIIISILLGLSCFFLRRFNSKNFIKIIKKKLITFSILVSSQIKQIAETSKNNKSIKIKSIISSSSILSKDVKNIFMKKFNCNFYECYGTSEISIATSINFLKEKSKIGSVGKAINKVKIKILGKNNKFLKKNEIGEIICKTPYKFSGYYKKNKITNNSFWNGFFKTGDLGSLDKDKYLYYKGRKKELIKSGGISIYPIDIEKVISTYNNVKECAVIPIANKNLGEVVAAVIVLKKNKKLDQVKLRHFCSSNLSDFQQPFHFFFRTKLPKNTLGKIKKNLLIEEYNKKDY